MKNKAYCRISTDQQEQERQLYILEKAGYTKENTIFYEEVFTGKNRKRPILIKLLDELEEGDKVIITDLSRLARSVKDLWEISDEIIKSKAVLVSLKENIDLSTSAGKLVFSVLGAINEFERDVLSDRTKEGLAAKKKNGVRLGRPNVISNNIIEEAIKTYISTDLSYDKVGKMYNISGVTVYNQIKKLNIKKENK